MVTGWGTDWICGVVPGRMPGRIHDGICIMDAHVIAQVDIHVAGVIAGVVAYTGSHPLLFLLGVGQGGLLLGDVEVCVSRLNLVCNSSLV